MAEEEKAAQEKPKGGSKAIIIAIVVAIVALLLIVGAILFVLLGSDESASAAASTAEAGAAAAVSAGQNRAAPSKRAADYLNMGQMYPLDQFIVNLLSENGSRYIKAKIDLEQSNEDLAAELDRKKPLIRDVIIRTLSSKTYEEISTSKGKDRLKDEIINRLNEVLHDGYVKNIYFTDFVVQ